MPRYCQILDKWQFRSLLAAVEIPVWRPSSFLARIIGFSANLEQSLDSKFNYDADVRCPSHIPARASLAEMSLDPDPAVGSPAGARAPIDPFYTATTYKGAFNDADLWIQNWTVLSDLGSSQA